MTYSNTPQGKNTSKYIVFVNMKFSCRLMIHFVQYSYMLYSKEILKLQKLF